MKIAVIGAGGWGTALSIILNHNSNDVTLWCFEKNTSDDIIAFRENKQFLPGVTIPLNMNVTSDLKQAVESSHVIVLSVPVQFLSSVLEKISRFDVRNKIFCNTAKGLEISSSRLPNQIIRATLKNVKSENIATLSGPSHAEESARFKPTNIISASSSPKSATLIKKIFNNSFFHVEKSKDIIGVELGAALKNVIAIGVGICDGLNYGDNTKAGLLIKGLNDIASLGKKLGAKKDTFYGLSGLGDLMVTCYSRHSRNRYVGEQIGTGKSLKEVVAGMKMVAEGVSTTKAAFELAEKHKVHSTVLRELYAVLFERKKPETAISNILNS